MFLALRSPKVDTAFQMWSHKWQGGENHYSTCLLCVYQCFLVYSQCTSWLLVLFVHCVVHQVSQVLFLKVPCSWRVPSCTAVWSCSIPATGLCICHCWTLYCQVIYPPYLGPSQEQPCLPMLATLSSELDSPEVVISLQPMLAWFDYTDILRCMKVMLQSRKGNVYFVLVH